jgi:hypothetical protein
MTPPCNQWLASIVHSAMEKCPSHIDAPNQTIWVLGYILGGADLSQDEVDAILKRLAGVKS